MAAPKEALTRVIATTVRLTIPAGSARKGPPISPALAPYRVKVDDFIKNFNSQTQKYKPDTPMAVTVTAYKDNTYDFTVKSPSVSWYLKKAAGLDKGTTRPGHLTVATLSVKHVYEIAKVKQMDPNSKYTPLESICKSIIGTANSMGIKILRDLE